MNVRCLTGLLAMSLAATATAQVSKSAPLAKELAAGLAAAGTTSIAAKAPSEQDLYVAAMYVPGTLLVVWARFPVPAALDAEISNKDYQNAYVDLQTASIAASKVFVQDEGADGLNLKTFDMVDTVKGSTVFDGDWKKAKAASEQEYEKAFVDADADYARMLTILLGSLRKPS